MDYFINPLWFYLANVANNIGSWLFGLSIVGVIGCFVCLIGFIVAADYYCADDPKKENADKKLTSYLKKFITMVVVGAILSCVVPSQQTCEKMIVASVVTKSNVEYTEEEIKEIIDYVAEKFNETQAENE